MKKILVIEDEAQIRNILLEWLEIEGFYAIGVENGLVAVEQVQEELPDLILCEITIPQLNCYGVLTRLRQDPLSATIPFIFVTTKVDGANFRKAMELGADDYLTKPFIVDELLKAITTCFSKRATVQQGFTASAQLVSALPPTDTTSRKPPKAHLSIRSPASQNLPLH